MAVIVATNGEYSDKEEPKQIEAKDRNGRGRDRAYHHYTSNVTTLTLIHINDSGYSLAAVQIYPKIKLYREN